MQRKGNIVLFDKHEIDRLGVKPVYPIRDIGDAVDVLFHAAYPPEKENSKLASNVLKLVVGLFPKVVAESLPEVTSEVMARQALDMLTQQ
jgi:hypothetical protein